MITSTLGRIADADKLDVRQLQQAIQSGSIPAYIGVPMLQDKMKQQRQMAQAPKEPPIADEIMARASGIDQVPSNLPVQGYNDGGIVAFAEGGAYDDEDYEDYMEQQDEAEHQNNLASDRAMFEASLEAMPVNRTPNVEHGIRPTKEGIKEGATSEGIKAVLPEGKEFYKAVYTTLKDKAEAAGLKNPEAIARLGAAQSVLETGYGKHLAGGNNFFGIKGGDNKQRTQEFDPATGKMVEANESFRTYGGMGDSVSDYLRFLQGNKRYEGVLGAESPEQAIAMQGKTGYATDPAYGNKLRAIHVANMAEGGITNLAGGSIAHFYKGGVNDVATSYPIDDPLAGSTMSPEDLERLKIDNPNAFQQWMRDHLGGAQPYAGYSNTSMAMTPRVEDVPFSKFETPAGAALVTRRQRGASNAAPPALVPAKRSFIPEQNVNLTELNIPYSPLLEDESGRGIVTPQQEEFNRGIAGSGSFIEPANKENTVQPSEVKTLDLTEKKTAPTETQPTAPARTSYDEFMDYFRQGREDLKKQKQEDKYMALLQAGLGMMSGTSPNALANIGQGGSMGVAHYGASAKQRAAEEAALMKGAITAQRYKEMGEDRRAQQDLMKSRYGAADLLGKEKLEEQTHAALEKTIENRENKIRDNVLKALKIDPLAPMTGEIQAKINRETARQLASDPRLNQLHKALGPLWQKRFGFDYEAPDYGANAFERFSLVK
jgi:flagellum-specific peptidoglycan hydrolase FlgJ